MLLWLLNMGFAGGDGDVSAAGTRRQRQIKSLVRSRRRR